MSFQLFVIGGGSGGLSAARTAAGLGVKVALADFVKPSPPGTTWGVGGTCVNVGCIPKKLYHHASLLGEHIKDAIETGWSVNDNAVHNWAQVRERIHDHIVASNKGYEKTFKREGIVYYNKLAKIVAPNTVELTDKEGKTEKVTAEKIVIATGGRPTYPDIPGAKEYAITSDDVFSLEKAPGKTLVVGASYIALETAGFLHGLGTDVTVMVRSILLRGFDQQMANKIGESMELLGQKFIKQAVPTSIRLNNEGRKVVTYKQGDKEHEEVFDTVLFAIGRSADTKGLDLDKIGVKTAPNGKIIAYDDDTTDAKDVYAIGDVVQGRLELTPTAILAGKLLSGRLFGQEKELMNYKNVPTTVFTPIEYGAIGYSQEDAIAKFGENNIVAYASKFRPLEWSLNY